MTNTPYNQLRQLLTDRLPLDMRKNIKNVKLTFTNDKTYTFDNVDEIHMFGRGGSVVKIKSKDLSDDFIKIK